MKTKFLLAFLGGAAAGAAIGLFLSSDSGKKLRNDLANKARDLADAVLAKAEEIIEEAETTKTKA